MDLLLDELVGALKKFSSEDNDGGGAISDLSVLNLRQFDENFGGWVSHLELLEDSGAIVGDGDIAYVIDEHLVKTHGSKTCFNDVCERSDRGNYKMLEIAP